MTRLLRAALILLSLIGAFYAGVFLDSWYASEARRRLAEGYVSLALRLTDPHESFARARRRYEIPVGLTRDEAIQHYLLSGSALDYENRTGARYFLGIFFLSRNCELAQSYLRQELAIRRKDAELSALIQRLHEEGCAATAAKMTANQPRPAD